MKRGYRTKRAAPKRAKSPKRSKRAKRSKKSKSTDSAYRPSVHNSMDKCLKLFKISHKNILLDVKETFIENQQKF